MSQDRFTKVIDGEQVVKTFAQGGPIIPEDAKDPSKYFTALVDTAAGPQLCVKTYLMGMADDIGSTLIQIVAELPETGVGGVLYGTIMPEMTRDNYGIIQFFVWYNDDWYAVGAYSIDIDPNGIVYEDAIPYGTSTRVGGIKQSFDGSTNTWSVVTED